MNKLLSKFIINNGERSFILCFKCYVIAFSSSFNTTSIETLKTVIVDSVVQHVSSLFSFWVIIIINLDSSSHLCGQVFISIWFVVCHRLVSGKSLSVDRRKCRRRTVDLDTEHASRVRPRLSTLNTLYIILIHRLTQKIRSLKRFDS